LRLSAQHRPIIRDDERPAMQQKLFALSLGFGGLILATHHAFAAVSGPFAGPARTGAACAGAACAAPVAAAPREACA